MSVLSNPMEPKTILRRLGSEIRLQREKRNLSQQELADQAKVHTNVIGRLERGIQNPTILTVISIAGALGTTLNDLINRSAKSKDY